MSQTLSPARIMTFLMLSFVFEQMMPTETSHPPDSSQEEAAVAVVSDKNLNDSEETGIGQENELCDGDLEDSLGGALATENRPSTSMAPFFELSRKKQPLLHIDRQQIQCVAHGAQTAELKGLGVDVYDQDILEQGVLQQVDNAINEANKTTKIADAEKEYQSVLDDLR